MHSFLEVHILFTTIDIKNRKGNGFDNLIGRKFGRLTVIGLSEKKSGRKSYWVCECDCGNKKLVRSDSLKSGQVQSCGCLKAEQNKINLCRTTHGDTPTGAHKRLWQIWQGMKQRTSNPNKKSYDRYGGRGVTVCKEWSESYVAFRDWALASGYADNLSIDRIDNNGNYEPSNCRWATFREQCNNRRSNVLIEWDGRTQNIQEWADETGLPYQILHDRYKRYGILPPELFAPIGTLYKKTPR
jgi:hypothetical protein